MTSSSGSSSQPSSSASIPRLRAEDLPQTPRRLSFLFAVDVLVGDAMGLLFVGLAVLMVGLWVALAAHSDLKSSDHDRVCCDGVVTSRWESDDNWTVRASGDCGEVESFLFIEPPEDGAPIHLRGDASCTRLHLDHGFVRRVPSYAAFAFLLPLIVGAPLLAGPLRRRWRRLRLLREGTLTRGRKHSHTTNSEGDWDVHTFVFTFTDDRGRDRAVSATTTQPGPLLDEEEEALLYDPDATGPDDAALLDALPGLPRLKDGRFVPSRWLKSAVVGVVVCAAAVSLPVSVVVGLLLALR